MNILSVTCILLLVSLDKHIFEDLSPTKIQGRGDDMKAGWKLDQAVSICYCQDSI